jgi:hypothetical protein
LRRAPFWPGLEAVAPTLAYDHAAILGAPWSVPTELAARVSVPALVMAGDTARALSQAIPQGQLRMLAGQAHQVNPGVLAPVLVEFFTAGKDKNKLSGTIRAFSRQSAACREWELSPSVRWLLARARFRRGLLMSVVARSPQVGSHVPGLFGQTGRLDSPGN